MAGKKITLSQIAEQVGCSLTTVSRVLSGSDYPVNEELAKNILSVAEAQGYSAFGARKLAQMKNSRDIGVLVPTIANPFYSQLLIGIESICDEYGYTPFFCSSRRDVKKEIQNLRLLRQKSVAGMIVSSINENHTLLSNLAREDIPLVVFDQNLEDLKVSHVKFDYFEAGRLAVEYLALKGHKRIAFASPPINRSVRQEALDGYRDALRKFSLEQREDYLLLSESENEQDDGMYDFQNGNYLARKLLQLPERPTAVFTINDMTAFGVIDELQKQGVRVPEDVSVVGFDNLEISSLFSPPLTTINQPAYEIGCLTARILIEHITGARTEHASINLRPSIVERSTVRALY